MIHEWTPTRISPGNSPTITTDTLCPTCWLHPETPTHLHQCNHPTRNKIYQTLQLQLSKLFFKFNLDLHLYQMYWLGLRNTHDNQTQHTINMYPPPFHNLFQTQSEIGWKQLHYSRFSKHWTHYLSQHHPTSKPQLSTPRYLP